jgi:hypothetical protein
MVKNTHGGNKSKSMARKNTQNDNDASSEQLRHPAHDFEQIAFVTRALGNGMFYATNTLGNQLLVHIRNKFKGRSRRNNDVSLGKLVLIGLRDWEHPYFKNADLLFVYDDHHFHALSSKHDLSAFYTLSSSHIPSISNDSHDSLFYDYTNTLPLQLQLDDDI